MNDDPKTAQPPLLFVRYDTIRELTAFQEQYDRLILEMQQVQVQLDSSPSLEPDSPRAAQRQEWRAWLQLQIKNKKQAREDLLKAMLAKNIVIEELPH